MKKQKLIIGIFLLGIVFTILGTTFAYWNWMATEEEKTSITFTIANNFSCAADGGGDITVNDVTLIPTTVSEATSGNYIKREVKVRPTLTLSGIYIYMDLWLDINDIGSGLSNSDNFMYAFTTSSTSPTEGVINSGNFKGKTIGDKVNLLSEKGYNKTVTETYYLWIWLDAKETSPETMNQTFSLSLNGNCNNETGVDVLIEKVNPSTLSYSDATEEQKGEMWTFSHEATDQVGATTDYRYIGNIPNNYINFNNEVWRIIGVFDGKIKIIKDDIIGNMCLDIKDKLGSAYLDSNRLSAHGSNDWTDAQLMYMLNPTTYKLNDGYSFSNNSIYDKNNKVFYQLGCKPARIAGGQSYSCTTNTWSLDDVALSQISDAIYYLGGSSSASGHDASAYYTFERGIDVYSGRPTNWQGYVGLMYPSDYAYTFANGVDDKCYADIHSCSNGTPKSSWLYKSDSSQWTISPYNNLNYMFYISFTGNATIGGAGYADIDYNCNQLKVRPVVYLRSDIKLSGNGTNTSPYEIKSD